jgi:hypothetical protein
MGRLFNDATQFYSGLTTQPSAERVALRALAMHASCERSYSEIIFLSQNGKPKEEPPPLPPWVINLAPQLVQELAPNELLPLETPIGMVSPRIINAVSWLSEGLTVLWWALGIGPFPEWSSVLPSRVLKLVTTITPETFPTEAKLRPLDELRMYAENCSTWQWRFIEYILNGKEHIDMEKECKQRGFLYEQIALIGGDLAIAGSPFKESIDIISADNLPKVADERLRAAMWLCGFKEKYWEIEV